MLLALPRPAGAAREPPRLAGDRAARAARRRRRGRAAREPARRRAGGGARAARAGASAGNPLFAEELVGDARRRRRAAPRGRDAATLERELDAVALPASLNALLGARLDRLDAEARDALERGAVEGELFHRGAVVELSDAAVAPGGARRARAAGRQGPDPPGRGRASPARPRSASSTSSSARPPTGQPRRSCAPLLHEHFADWLERLAGERVGEYEEILGYHLEQAYRYRAELGPLDDDAAALAERAARRLGAAGRRAWNRGDVGAAANLLGRATALLPANSSEQIELVPDLVESLAEGASVAEARAARRSRPSGRRRAR